METNNAPQVMHLALVIASLDSGGAERVLAILANHWIGRGHKVSFVTLADPKSTPFYFLHPSINLIQLNQSQAGTAGLVRIKNNITRIFRLRKALKELNPDIIVSFVDLMNIAMLISKIGLRIPAIISERIDPNMHPISKLYAWMRFRFYALAERLVVQTKNSASYFPEKFNKIIKIIPNPVFLPQKQKIRNNKEVKNIITIGRLDSQKDHVTLIRSFSELIKVHPNLTLTIYGKGEERSHLESLVAALSLQGKVRMPGTTQSVNEALLEADLFISRYGASPCGCQGT